MWGAVLAETGVESGTWGRGAGQDPSLQNDFVERQ